MPKFTRYLRTWGEAGTVKSGKDGKLGNCGITIMMVGCANHHGGNVYRILNLETGRITETRDIIWLFCMYYKNVNSKTTRKLPVVSLQVPRTVNSDDEDDDRIINEAVPILNSEDREDNDSDSTSTESSSSQVSKQQMGKTYHQVRTSDRSQKWSAVRSNNPKCSTVRSGTELLWFAGRI